MAGRRRGLAARRRELLDHPDLQGDNLYTDSVVAIDVNTGEIRWHYQFTPHDLWDYDSTMENLLFDGPDGRKLLAHADKNPSAPPSSRSPFRGGRR